MGALYMVLTLAVMVPMAFLTEAVISHLSSELQTSDVEIQGGAIQRAWLDPNGAYHKALLDKALLVANPEGCNAITDDSSAANEFEVREVLEGEQAQVASQPLPQRRFYVLKRKDAEASPAAYVIKVEGVSGNQEEMLPWPQATNRCSGASGVGSSAGYKAPEEPAQVSFCAVSNADDVLVSSVNQRRNSAWKWRWSESREGPADRPCICLPNEPCFEAAT
jgi:hypothetical protein